MQIRNATVDQVKNAISQTQNIYPGVQTFGGIGDHGEFVRVSIRIPDDSGKLVPPCWHVHAVFFNKLLSISPQAIIETGEYKLQNAHGDGRQGDEAQMTFKGNILYGLPYSKNYCACTEK